MTRGWAPLVDGALRERALAQVLAIADAVRGLGGPALPASLSSGHAGVGLFLAYVDEVFPGRGYDEPMWEHLGEATEGAGASGGLGLSGGVAGVAWVLEHVQGQDEDDEDANQEVDEVVLEALGGAPWRGHFDLISGLVGLGVYLLERGDRARARAGLARIVELLDAMALRDGDGAWLRTSPALLPPWRRAGSPDGQDDLGVAHGLAGVLALLGSIALRPDAPPRARPLLHEVGGWLLARGLVPDGSGFGAACAPGQPAEWSRAAWCYGDAGTAAALAIAARTPGADPRWRPAAVEAARRSAARPFERTGVRDASLCHGTAGLLHLYNRLAQELDDPTLAEAARAWLVRTLELATPGQGVAGYRYFLPDRGWLDEAGFLEGAAGVGLALLAAASDREPAWDRALLISAAEPRS